MKVEITITTPANIESFDGALMGQTVERLLSMQYQCPVCKSEDRRSGGYRSPSGIYKFECEACGSKIEIKPENERAPLEHWLGKRGYMYRTEQEARDSWSRLTPRFSTPEKSG